MSNSKMTKRALLTSIMALMLCFAMLTGTTFAWFTDQETSANNKIIAGNLDVELLMWDGSAYVDIGENQKPIFGEGSIAQNNNAQTLWEPGKTQIAYLAIRNAGNLALQYNVFVDVVDGGLASALEYAIVPVDATANLAQFNWADVKAAALAADPSNAGDMPEGRVIAAQGGCLDEIAKDPTKVNETNYFALAIHMKEEADNEFMSKPDDLKSVTIDITVVATQVEAESDSFDEKYDEDSTYPVVPVVDTVTVPENNTEDVVLSTETVNVTVPASVAAAGDVYKIEVSNESTETDSATGKTTVAFDLTMYKNDTRVSGDTVYEVTKNIGTGLFVSDVTHNGTALTNAITGADQTYTYDSTTGVLTIYTKSFSSFSVTYNVLAENFADNSWDVIISACQSNSVPASWNVGDKKAMTIGDSTYDIVIIGKNHDEYTGGGKAPLTFQLSDVYGTTAAMNATQTNTTGWSGSKMRTETMVAILSAMPTEVKNAIKAVNKETLNGTRDGLETTSDKLFLLSETEVKGSNYFSNGYNEGARYAGYYSDAESMSMSTTWWLRGPGKSNAIGFTQINMSGYMANGSAEYACGVVFGFCF